MVLHQIIKRHFIS